MGGVSGVGLVCTTDPAHQIPAILPSALRYCTNPSHRLQNFHGNVGSLRASVLENGAPSLECCAIPRPAELCGLSCAGGGICTHVVRVRPGQGRRGSQLRRSVVANGWLRIVYPTISDPRVGHSRSPTLTESGRFVSTGAFSLFEVQEKIKKRFFNGAFQYLHIPR